MTDAGLLGYLSMGMLLILDILTSSGFRLLKNYKIRAINSLLLAKALGLFRGRSAGQGIH